MQCKSCTVDGAVRKHSVVGGDVLPRQDRYASLTANGG